MIIVQFRGKKFQSDNSIEWRLLLHEIGSAKGNAVRRIGSFCVMALFALGQARLAVAEEGPTAEHYLGVAYAPDNGKVLYTEEHWVTRDPQGENRVVLYRCPGGQPFARKKVYGGVDDAAPDFDFYDGRDGYREGVNGRSGERRVYVQQSRNALRRSAPIQSPPHAVIDAGFDAYLRDHWDALGRGKDANIAFLVPSRLAYINLKIQIRGEATMKQPVASSFLMTSAEYSTKMMTPMMTAAMGRMMSRLSFRVCRVVWARDRPPMDWANVVWLTPVSSQSVASLAVMCL